MKTEQQDKGKTKDAEMRMPAAEFDRIMQVAMGVPAPSEAEQKPVVTSPGKPRPTHK